MKRTTLTRLCLAALTAMIMVVAAPMAAEASACKPPVVRSGQTTSTGILLEGANFTGTKSVVFSNVINGVSANAAFTVPNDSKLDVTAPTGLPPERYSITVTNQAGSVTLDGWYIVASPKPVITSATPNVVPKAGGALIVIRGQYLSPIRMVSFVGEGPMHYNSVSSTELQIVAPAHAAGTFNLMITTQFGGSVSTPITFS